jgi:hypothetical protein
MVAFDIGVAEQFFALSSKARLSLILETTFADWCANLNQGVSLVYDNACAMIHGVTAGIFAIDQKPSGGAFEIFSSRLAMPIDLGLDHFNPDAGAFSTGADGGQNRFLLMLQTAVRSMSAADAPLEPRYLLPETPSIRRELTAAFTHIFSVQFRFWAQDLPDYEERYQKFRASLTEVSNVTLVEKDFSASLRRELRFRLKRKEPLETFETAVRAIAIGCELRSA